MCPRVAREASGGEDGAVFVWSLADGKPRKLTTHADVARDVVWTPDGTRVISGGGGHEVRVIELATGAIAVLAGNESGVKDLALSSDGRTVASARWRFPCWKLPTTIKIRRGLGNDRF